MLNTAISARLNSVRIKATHMVKGLAISAAQAIIILCQYTPFRGKGDYGTTRFQQKTLKGPEAEYPQAENELSRFDEFFKFFRLPTVDLFRGRTVLDLGSGYGGRSVGYATKRSAREVIGIEVEPKAVGLSKEYAQFRQVANCDFLLGTQEHVPVPSDSIDVIVSYDVLEHVADPRVTMREVHRVLRPGGLALIAFPPYYAMLNAHLTYITRVPGIHWLFSAETLVTAINRILSKPGGQRFHPRLQPVPRWSYNARRRCLPTLNGLTSSEFLSLLEGFGGFEVVEVNQMPLLQRYRMLMGVGVLLNRALMGIASQLRDALSFEFSCVLRKMN